jgi:RimJ/RimL family protein N-acetyltransferase
MSEATARTWRIPLSGRLCEGRCVIVGWPEEDEIDALTALRNRPQIRSKFLDPSPLHPARNREWIRSGMRRPFEALLAIRLKPSSVFVGAIGWSRGDPDEGSFELGRVMVDTAVVRQHRNALPRDYPGVAADAGMAVRDFGFRELGLSVIRSVFIAGNRLSRRAALLGGARVVGMASALRADGSEVPLVRLELARAEWESMFAHSGRSRPLDAEDVRR